MTRFIRHPADIPIEVKTLGQLAHDAHNTVNLSKAGLAFRSARAFIPGEIVEIRIPILLPPFDVRARIVWCKERESAFDIGVAFLHPDDFYLMRMVEQVCYIESYKKHILQTEGRRMLPEEAAREWIRQYAHQFPGASGLNT